MFKEFKRPSFKDLQGGEVFRFRVGDRVEHNGRSGIILEKRSLSTVLNSMSEVEAKRFISRLKSQYHDINEFYRAVVQIKNLIYVVDAHQMKPDTPK